MGAWDWRVSYKPASTFVALADVQTINISNGRRRQIDDFPTDRLTVTALNPSSWTNPPKLGQDIIAWVYTNQYPGYPSYNYWTMFQGRITDVAIEYGNVDDMDVATIIAEGLQAELGRAQINSYVLTQTDVGTQVFDIANDIGITFAVGATQSIAAAQTYTGNFKQFVDQAVRTEQGRLRSIAGAPTALQMGNLSFASRNTRIFLENTPKEFSDKTLSYANPTFEYQSVTFKSAAEDYYTRVTVQPDAVAAQTSDNGVEPPFSYAFSTFDATTGQALGLAQYVRNMYDATNATPRELAFTIEQQDGGVQDLLNIVQSFAGLGINIVLRGVRYPCIVEGVQINANPAQTRVTFFVSSSATNNFLVLDNAIYGKLDENKLGF